MSSGPWWPKRPGVTTIDGHRAFKPRQEKSARIEVVEGRGRSKGAPQSRLTALSNSFNQLHPTTGAGVCPLAERRRPGR